MSTTAARVFAYARVSTVEQLTENQRQQIEEAGYSLTKGRFVEEKVSGSVPAMQRQGFVKLLDRLEEGDTLVVTKLDRLGRDSIDVQQTVRLFIERGIRLVVLQLGGMDLTSSAGKAVVAMIAAIADFERDLIIERTQAGQARARAEGKHMGRPSKTTDAEKAAIRQRLEAGVSVSEVAREAGISRASVIAIRGATAAIAA